MCVLTTETTIASAIMSAKKLRIPRSWWRQLILQHAQRRGGSQVALRSRTSITSGKIGKLILTCDPKHAWLNQDSYGAHFYCGRE